MRNSFDLVSSFYDRMAGLVFGSQWEKIQMAPAVRLQKQREILIVGGGTGKLLRQLNQGNSVTFVELSKKMIRKAQVHKSDVKVTFVHTDYLFWETDAKFDAILFPFFLDLFNLSKLQLILAKAKGQLKKDGELHVIDFQKAGPAKNLLIKLMYFFFSVTANLEGQRLLDFDSEIRKAGFTSRTVRTYHSGWIFYKTYTVPATCFSKDG